MTNDDNLRTRITAIIDQHGELKVGCDGCDWTGESHAAHVADVLVTELGLYYEDGQCSICSAQLPCGRWVTDA